MVESRACSKCSGRGSRATASTSSRTPKTEAILEPTEYRTGTVIAPYNGAGK